MYAVWQLLAECRRHATMPACGDTSQKRAEQFFSTKCGQRIKWLHRPPVCASIRIRLPLCLENNVWSA